MRIGEVIDYLECRFPRDTALDFDKNRIGFAIGSKSFEVKGILLALDLTKEVLDEAISNNCNLIITHHPFIWDPFTKFMYDDYRTQIIMKMFEHKISLYSMHTNLDCAHGGVNDCLAEMLGLDNVKTLYGEEVINNNFFRYGDIHPLKLIDIASNIKKIFSLSGVRVLGDLNKEISKVCVFGGAGGNISDINDAKKVGCELLITGEIKLSSEIHAYNIGLCLIEVNHGVEKFVFNSLIEELRKQFKALYDYDGLIKVSNINTDKFITI